MTKPLLLITGAAGHIGSVFIQHAAADFRLRLADLRPVARKPGDAEFVSLDILDPDACRRACSDVDLVLHLAADLRTTAGFLDALLPNNIVGTYNVFEAAADAGCRRIVFASSAQAVEGYPLDVQVAESAPARPANLYGVCKAFGEALGAYYAHSRGMTCVAVRIANVAKFLPGDRPSPRDVAAFISERDVAHLLQRALLAELHGFHVVNGVSDNRYKRLAIDATRTTLDYRPRDDAFKILQVP